MTAKRSIQYIPAIDGLRALAVIAVMFYHLGFSWIPGGFLGVDLFFVISGYVITRMLLDSIAQSGGLDLRGFYLARLRRLLPALLFMLTTTIIAVGIWAPDTIKRLLVDTPFALTGTINWWLVANEQDYFENINTKLNETSVNKILDEPLKPDSYATKLGKSYISKVFDIIGTDYTYEDIFENIDIENISIKLRSAQKGKNQYNKLDYSGALLSVQEYGLLFLINPFDYLDTGLFLDHRITRQWVKKDALNKRVLNLFAYTGSFSVYAAAGDAVKVTTVDMSNTYLQWAEKNMHLNGFKSSKKYDYIREDILDWIPTVPPSSYDLIILDPPTFSNSKKMLLTWDVQRDHVTLINQIRSILSPGGVLYFSNNYKKFKLNLEDIEGYESIEELTDKSIPEDFERSKPHVCFRLINK